MWKKYSPVLAFLGIIFLGFLVWYFWNIVIYVIIAAVLSIMGHPLVRRFDRIRIGKRNLPRSLSALFTLIIMIGLLVGFLFFFVPLISRQAEMISSININDVLHHFSRSIQSLEEFLKRINFIHQGETIESSIKHQLEQLINLTSFSNVFADVLSATGSLLMGVFSILFITFFFLRDENMLRGFLILLFPERYEEQIKKVIGQIKHLLSRYFIGLMGELLSMMTLLTIGLTIIGVENALIIGFLGGLMNIIPYLGPLIGGSIGVFFAATSALSLQMYDQLGWLTFGVIIVFLIANLIDNIVLQPLIYSTSVKARPIEIFLVIIMAGSLAGIAGMILAIPSYTVLRIIAKEFLSQFRIVKKLTEKM
ncbi:MAG: AI-2E family transporter [Bacteroidales bacterium]|nr:AI-2E family transporter [Bacteroidales bacterium]MCF8388789.1 AI-2E family transporter [Bacteroidales bacterium]MCF8399229.1 AI-2E family transporter [Bacteroidales bacterium]